MAARATKADLEGLEQRLDTKIDEVRDNLRDEIRANGILLEQLNAKVEAIIQALPAYAPMSDEPRVAVLESIARDTTADIRKNTRRIASVEKRIKR